MKTLIPDISHHHKCKNWKALLSECDFVISKATEGTSYVDPTLKEFIKACEANKKAYWLYVFLRKGNELEQAKFMVKTCKPLVGNYFIGYCLDIESKNDASACKEALSYIKKESSKTMIYTMYSEYSKYASLILGRGSSCAWWEARYGANNGKDTSAKYPCHKGADLHQFTSQGKNSYLEGYIDLNKLTGNMPLTFFTGKGNRPKQNKNTGTALKYSKAVKAYQEAYNRYFKDKLAVDGLKGNKTKSSFDNVLLEYKGSAFDYRTDLVKLVQSAVGANPDGKYGANTASKVKSFQNKNGLTADGIVGPKTWDKIVK